jgi:hypothetical protein
LHLSKTKHDYGIVLNLVLCTIQRIPSRPMHIYCIMSRVQSQFGSMLSHLPVDSSEYSIDPRVMRDWKKLVLTSKERKMKRVLQN